MPTSAIYSLAAASGPFHQSDLLHLLRRTLFGVGIKEMNFFKGMSLHKCIDILLTPAPAGAPLVQWDSSMPDPLVAEGKPWMNAPYENVLIDTVREGQLKMWWIGHILNRDCSLSAKMTLFWHNHFVIEMDVVKDARYSYLYYMLLRRHSLGNFKSLIKEGSITPAMLVYLNGNSNVKAAPNENYSRELMELFTIGKNGKQNYSEEDVKNAARVLTGWKDNKSLINPEFIPSLHDTSDKQFSSFFGNRVIKGQKEQNGMREKDELVDMIFSVKETAMFFCRNIYRWFVSPNINEDVEKQIIEPLSDIFIGANFEVIPVLRKLLSSVHFFDSAFRGCIVKSPIDFFLGAMQQLDVVSSANLDTNHNSWYQFYIYTEDLTLNLGDPPSVAGWPAYYQAPKFHQWWINSASLSMRKKVLYLLCTPEGVIFNGPNIRFDFLHFLKQFPSAGNAEKFIDECLQLLIAVPVSATTRDKIKDTIMPDSTARRDWSMAWDAYLADNSHTSARNLLESGVRSLIRKIIIQPEFQMM